MKLLKLCKMILDSIENLLETDETIKGKFSVINPKWNYTDKSLRTSIESSKVDKSDTHGYETGITGFSLASGWEQYDDVFFTKNLLIPNDQINEFLLYCDDNFPDRILLKKDPKIKLYCVPIMYTDRDTKGIKPDHGLTLTSVSYTHLTLPTKRIV